MKNLFHSVLFSIIVFFMISCTDNSNDRNQILLQVEGKKRQIQLIDNEINQLEKKKGFYMNNQSQLGFRMINKKIDPELNQLYRAREVLLIDLESLYKTK